ncbi:MAG: spermidine/putrescine ABC transporter substrate-binding protein [Oscillospiraceae bacterium]|nr:spermidine/putrescine ABC transporter substrate-binding protein [Oscillospiraceae bacterium]
MKLIAKILLAAVLAAALVPAFYGCTDSRESINVFNWGEYIDPDVIKTFESETGMRVNYTTYATNEELYAKLTSGGANYDVVIPSDYMLSRFISEGMLEKLNFDNIPNFSYITKEYQNPVYDPQNEYSVPYMWGTVVLIYNTKYVPEPDSWDILWDEQYKGQIIMFDNSRDAFGISLLRLGYSVNTTNAAELEHAAAELSKQRELVQGYYMDEIFNKMGGEEAWIAPYYAGDALTMMEDNPDVAAVFPKEGTNRFVDAVCIPKGAQNKEGAEKFIDFLMRPDIAAQNSEYIGYATPNGSAYELLGDEITSDPVAYPSDEILANTEMFINLPDDINRLKDSLWIDIRGGLLN